MCVPLVGRDDPGQQVHREGALDALVVAVDGEGDALGAEGVVAEALPPGQLGRGEPRPAGGRGPRSGAGRAGVVEDLVEEAPLARSPRTARSASAGR